MNNFNVGGIDLYQVVFDLVIFNKEMLGKVEDIGVFYNPVDLNSSYEICLGRKSDRDNFYIKYFIDQYVSTILVTYSRDYVDGSVDFCDEFVDCEEFCYDGFSLEDIRFSLLKINVDLFNRMSTREDSVDVIS